MADPNTDKTRQAADKTANAEAPRPDAALQQQVRLAGRFVLNPLVRIAPLAADDRGLAPVSPGTVTKEVFNSHGPASRRDAFAR